VRQSFAQLGHQSGYAVKRDSALSRSVVKGSSMTKPPSRSGRAFGLFPLPRPR
jgi:hypothetical protein